MLQTEVILIKTIISVLELLDVMQFGQATASVLQSRRKATTTCSHLRLLLNSETKTFEDSIA